MQEDDVQPDEPGKIKAFDQCPNCGSKAQFCKDLGDELKDKGLARESFLFRYEQRQGVVMDQERTVLMPIGIKIPGFSIDMDICSDCGTFYATQLVRLEARTEAAPPQPNRAQRRHPPSFN